MDSVAGTLAARHAPVSDVYLRSPEWDRLFIWGGVALVPVPILAFYLLRGVGLDVAVSEDLVTLLVMVSVGGPHVFATYTRTFLNPSFRGEDRAMFWAALVVMGLVMGAAISSAFFDVRILGVPPIQLVLTFFFFWAGVHIVQQSSYCASCYGEKAKDRPSLGRWWRGLDYAVMLLALYPLAIFRMSMGHPGDPSGLTANPDALATKIVVALSGSAEFADDYVFRIGRVAPVLPDFMRADWFWMLVTAAFVTCLILFFWKSNREHRQGILLRNRYHLVLAMAVAGMLVPVFPNMDTAFQGMNAWHSFQYLGLLWLMNRRSYERGEIRNRFFDVFSSAGKHWRFYAVALGATLGLLLVVLLAGWAIHRLSDGEFALFASRRPVDEATGAVLYRPGSVLLAYYMVAFSLLLVHYLHDGVFFFRKRYLLGRDPL